MNRDFIHALARVLAPGATLRVATDDEAYAQQIGAALSAEPLIRNANAPAAYREQRPETLETAFECEWRTDGRRCFYFDYCRNSASIRPAQGVEPRVRVSRG